MSCNTLVSARASPRGSEDFDDGWPPAATGTSPGRPVVDLTPQVLANDARAVSSAPATKAKPAKPQQPNFARYRDTELCVCVRVRVRVPTSPTPLCLCLCLSPSHVVTHPPLRCTRQARA